MSALQVFLPLAQAVLFVAALCAGIRIVDDARQVREWWRQRSAAGPGS